eukprot:CAMPEP_0201647144 /NCGR_PEP_ID=MMETSP0493-20130528/35243_1 /ASSEMBLY_ACC=CAM_ASM_000838 /TAXON_ID=420259 /ORGANISM="Thalassiosira gravida, Strain GMp14c1" /LENGTH=58 /DNA_ID=CAMNT_0048122473 /DNA_START=145 /DNA_END=324 /DNA_ORIENTATION=-
MPGGSADGLSGMSVERMMLEQSEGQSVLYSVMEQVSSPHVGRGVIVGGVVVGDGVFGM